ncbi:MAG: hypothetical protein KKB31_06740 [Nanoarchaeota archaeon]|nr:hypothetical protein [Nanoarchaeota archaeon]
MEYKSKNEAKSYISAGTAGVAQRIDSEAGNVDIRKKYSLVALTQNDVMPCSHNQF